MFFYHRDFKKVLLPLCLLNPPTPESYQTRPPRYHLLQETFPSSPKGPEGSLTPTEPEALTLPTQNVVKDHAGAGISWKLVGNEDFQAPPEPPELNKKLWSQDPSVS